MMMWLSALSSSTSLCFALNCTQKKDNAKTLTYHHPLHASALQQNNRRQRQHESMSLSSSPFSLFSMLSCSKEKNNIGIFSCCHPLWSVALQQNNKWQWRAWVHSPPALRALRWVATKKNDKGRGASLVAHSTKLHADEAPPCLSPHSFQALETQSSATLNHGPIEFQALAMEGSASTKEGWVEWER